MPGQSRSKNGVASLAYGGRASTPFGAEKQDVDAGTNPAMTMVG
jgi:hypothetical protein